MDRVVGLYKYKVVDGDLLGGHRSTPVRHKHMLFPPACIFPLITEDLPELRASLPLMHGQNWFLVTFHPLSKAIETYSIYNSNFKCFINFYGLSEKCKALYSVNCLLVSIVNFIHLLSAMGNNWFFLRRVFCC